MKLSVNALLKLNIERKRNTEAENIEKIDSFDLNLNLAAKNALPLTEFR